MALSHLVFDLVPVIKKIAINKTRQAKQDFLFCKIQQRTNFKNSKNDLIGTEQIMFEISNLLLYFIKTHREDQPILPKNCSWNFCCLLP